MSNHDFLEYMPTLGRSLQEATPVAVTVAPDYITLTGRVVRFVSPDDPAMEDDDGTPIYELDERVCVALDSGEMIRLGDMVEVVGV